MERDEIGILYLIYDSHRLLTRGNGNREKRSITLKRIWPLWPLKVFLCTQRQLQRHDLHGPAQVGRDEATWLALCSTTSSI